MRIILFFDLPVKTSSDRRIYASFRKHLIKSGFLMMQESVYIKLAINQNAADEIIKNIKKVKPPSGIVQILTVTEKQFQKMDLVVGTLSSDVIDSDERLVII